MKTYTLTISPEYVSKWGTWEAIRELLQNAFDQRDWDSSCAVEFSHDSAARTATIGTSTGRLSPRSLLLGNSSKAADTSLRGQFGEGYKLAILVLIRSAHAVKIFNGPDVWIPKLEHDEDFGCDILKIDVHEGMGFGSQGVRFIVSNIEDDEWAAIQRNINPNQKRDTIIEDADQKGRIYVGGLYVTTIANLRNGYAFSPASLTLDRDRGMVSNFDVEYATSKLWTHRQDSDPDKVYAMIEAEAPDVSYCESHASSSSPVTKIAFDTFVARNGDSIPVSDKEDIVRAQNAGVKWTLVPSSLRSILRKVKTWIIPTSLSATDRLKEFIARNEYVLTDEMKIELADIAAKFEGHAAPDEPTIRQSYRLQAVAEEAA